MKTYCRGLAIDRAFFEAGYADWLGADSGRKNGWRVAVEYGSADALLGELVAEYGSRSVAFEAIQRYWRDEGGKRRLIGIVSIKQQVVEHAIVVAMSGLLEDKIGYWQVASVEGKGAFFGARKCQRLMRSCRYGVHADCRKAYQSVDLAALMGLLRRLVACDGLVYLIGRVLAMYAGGLEIGSYLSLKLAQLVFSVGYHHVESLGKRRRGKWVPWAHQIWYADDIYLFGNSKRDLVRAVRSLADCLSAYGLSLKPWKVVRCDSETVDFAGIRCSREKRVLRRRLFIRARRAFSRFARAPDLGRARRAVSYFGWLKHSDCLLFRARGHIDEVFARARRTVSIHDRRINELSVNGQLRAA